MKHSRYGVLFLLAALGAGLAAVPLAAADKDCPTGTLKGVVARIDIERQHIALLTQDEQEMGVLVNDETQYRIPGFKKKDLQDGALAKVPLESQAEIKYCMTTGQAVEVKVKKLKAKKK